MRPLGDIRVMYLDFDGFFASVEPWRHESPPPASCHRCVTKTVIVQGEC